MQERRMFERFDARLPAKMKDTREEYGSNISLRNASAQGLKITSMDRLFLNDAVTLDIKIPGRYNPIYLKGKVVWVRKADHNLWAAGIKFHQIPFVQMSLIYEAVS